MNSLQKKILYATAALALIVCGVYLTARPRVPERPAFKQATFLVAGRSVSFASADTVESAPTVSMNTKAVTKYFGNEATGDVSGDGQPDIAFILTQETGGTGTFYYVAAAVKTAAGYQGSSAVYLGDRIAPQTTEIRNGLIIVNYAERQASAPMTATPSVARSMYLKLNPTTMQLGETPPPRTNTP